jgi:hypothetical protein
MGVIALVVALIAVFFEVTGPNSPSRSHRRQAAAAHHSKKPEAKAATTEKTFLGPDGVESDAIIAENRLRGTSAWEISGPSPTGFIEGFANMNYAAVGDDVGLYVSTSAELFSVVAYRMGYYQGLGARQIWTSPEVAGQVQAPCPVTPVTNMVSCDNWVRSLTIPISSAFVEGDYLLQLVGSGGQESYVPLTIWDPTSTATYFIMARSFTEQGWNNYGGYDYYEGTGPCPKGSGTYPVCNRARVVSFDRPYATGSGASDFLSNEYPLVRFAEEHGLDVSYGTDLTVDEHPTVLLQHRVLLSLGHDELWSYPEREAAQTAQSDGVNIVFFGAASVLRHCRLQPSLMGPDREEVDYRDSTEDPLNGISTDAMEVTGNTWSSPPTSWPESGFVGEVYAGYTDPGAPLAAFVVSDASAWLFKGTGLQDGSSVPDLIQSDFDHVDPSQPIPSDLEVLGHSPIGVSEAVTDEGEWGGYTYSDMTYYTDSTSNGGVFDTGNNNWIYALTPCTGASSQCPANVVGQMTGNLLWLFGQGPAGSILPSVANWQALTPKGS